MLSRWASKSKMSYKSPPPTLLVLYDDKAIGELKKVDGKYQFHYLDGFREMNLSPLPGLPLEGVESMHDELPLFFKERLPDLRRPEISNWLRANPSVDRNDDLQLLGALGAHSITDSFVLSRSAA